jgi:hypothetical protein
VSNTEFEGGDDGHGHGEGTFLVKQAQPSHDTTCCKVGESQTAGCVGTGRRLRLHQFP